MSYVLSILPQLTQGFMITLEIFFVTIILSIPLGLVVSYLLRVPILNWIINIYIWVMRGTPLLLQIFFFYYVLPMIGITINNRLLVGIMAFVINYAAYFAEIFRGGIGAIPKGQYEAAQMLKLSKWQTTRLIILPQVFKIVLPSIMNETVNLVKDTSLIYVVALNDIMLVAFTAMNRDVTPIPIFVAGIFYLIFCGLLTVLSKFVEKRFSYYK